MYARQWITIKQTFVYCTFLLLTEFIIPIEFSKHSLGQMRPTGGRRINERNSRNCVINKTRSHFSQFRKFELFMAVISPISLPHKFPWLTLKLHGDRQCTTIRFFFFYTADSAGKNARRVYASKKTKGERVGDFALQRIVIFSCLHDFEHKRVIKRCAYEYIRSRISREGRVCVAQKRLSGRNLCRHIVRARRGGRLGMRLKRSWPIYKQFFTI